MSVQNNIGYKPVKLGVKLPDGTTYWLAPQSRKALKAEVDTLARKLNVDAKALRHKLFASIEQEGMEFPSDHTQAEIDQRKLRSAEAADIHAFVFEIMFSNNKNMIPKAIREVSSNTTVTDIYNNILATLKVAVDEDADNPRIKGFAQNPFEKVTDAHIEAYRTLRKGGGVMENGLKKAIDFNESRRQDAKDRRRALVKKRRQDAKDRRRALVKKRRHRKVKPKAWAQTRPAGFTPRDGIKRGGHTKKSGTFILPKGVALSVGMGLSETNRGTSTSISCRKAIDLDKATKPLTKAAFLLSAGGGEKHWRKVEKQEAARKRRAKYRKNGKSRSSRAAAMNGGSGESAKHRNPAYGDNC